MEGVVMVDLLFLLRDTQDMAFTDLKNICQSLSHCSRVLRSSCRMCGCQSGNDSI